QDHIAWAQTEVFGGEIGGIVRSGGIFGDYTCVAGAVPSSPSSFVASVFANYVGLPGDISATSSTIPVFVESDVSLESGSLLRSTVYYLASLLLLFACCLDSSSEAMPI